MSACGGCSSLWVRHAQVSVTGTMCDHDTGTRTSTIELHGDMHNCGTQY